MVLVVVVRDSLWKAHTRDIVARIYGEYGGEARLYYADDSAIWAIHCESFKSLFRGGYVHICTRDMLLYCVLKGPASTHSKSLERKDKNRCTIRNQRLFMRSSSTSSENSR